MAVSAGKLVLTRLLSVVVVVVGMTALTWLSVFSVPGVFTGMRRGIAAGDFQLLFGLTAVAAALVAIAGLVTDLVLA